MEITSEKIQALQRKHTEIIEQLAANSAKYDQLTELASLVSEQIESLRMDAFIDNLDDEIDGKPTKAKDSPEMVESKQQLAEINKELKNLSKQITDLRTAQNRIEQVSIVSAVKEAISTMYDERLAVLNKHLAIYREEAKKTQHNASTFKNIKQALSDLNDLINSSWNYANIFNKYHLNPIAPRSGKIIAMTDVQPEGITSQKHYVTEYRHGNGVNVPIGFEVDVMDLTGKGLNAITDLFVNDLENITNQQNTGTFTDRYFQRIDTETVLRDFLNIDKYSFEAMSQRSIPADAEVVTAKSYSSRTSLTSPEFGSIAV